ncbi:MAG: MFS transporter [Holosporales bacterium]|jgi:MFS family permease|nr:MFS transporter [Holosporales bacterium]
MTSSHNETATYVEDAKSRSSFWLILIVFFSTVATMMVTTVLPSYFNLLGLTYEQIGRIEGWAAFVAFFSKFWSGVFSDKIRKRQQIVALGAALSVLSKASFTLATGYASILAVQVCDRFAKGMRSCPLDAMISDCAGKRKRSYGLKHVAFFCGSIFGSYLTFRLLRDAHLGIKSIFTVAAIPAIVASFIASNKLNDNKVQLEGEKISLMYALKNIDRYLWRLYSVLFLLMFARFSISFLILKSISLGTPIASIPRMFMLYDCSAAFAALFWSAVASKVRQDLLFKAALIAHIMAHCVLVVAHQSWILYSSIILAGIHIGMSQGSIMFMISSHAKPFNRATAFSIYSLVASVGLLLSNRIAGLLSSYNPSYAFLCGASLSAFALLAFTLLEKSRSNREGQLLNVS